MHVIRREVMEKILYNLNFKVNSVIVGKPGVGKTALLKYLESFAPNAYYISSSGPKQILLQVLKKAKIPCKSGELVADLENKAKKIKDLALLVDDADKLSKPAKRVLEALRASMILATEKPLAINYEVINLEGFNDEELKDYLKSFMLTKEMHDKVYYFIKNYSDSSPLSVKRAVELYSKNLETKQVFSLFSFTSKKIELLTIASFMSIGYLLMSLRYLLYYQKDFHLGYALGTLAYIIFFLFRRRK